MQKVNNEINQPKKNIFFFRRSKFNSLNFHNFYLSGKKSLIRKLALSALLSILIFQVYGKENYKHTALAWSSSKNCSWDNIIPLVRLAKNSMPEDIVKKVNKLPEGYRAIFPATFHRAFYRREIKNYEKRMGKHLDPKEYSSINRHPDDGLIWWDNGTEVVHRRFERFFAEYKQKGGKLDFLIMDFEKGMSIWHLGRNPKKFKEIEKDPRFPEIAAQLGFNDLSNLSNNYLKSTDYIRWNSLMQKRVAGYVNKAIYEPVKKFYPNVSMSNYSYRDFSEKFPVPDKNGHKNYMFYPKRHVGTHQSPYIYCILGNIIRSKFAGKATPFNGFKYSLNVLRSAKLASDIPLLPWISYKRFKESQVKNSDLYQEMIFHIGLSGVKTFLLWNPRPWKKNMDIKLVANDDQDKIVSDCLHQLDEMIGKGGTSCVEQLIPWSADYVLTGMRLKDKSIWRFTPDTGVKQNIN